MQVANISAQEAQRRLEADDQVIYLDVRTVEEFDAGHVPGALNIPVIFRDGAGQSTPNESFLAVVEASIPRDASVIVGCRSGGRSMRAAQIMLAGGYRSVVNMDGGMAGRTDPFGRTVAPGWTTCGLPTSTDAAPNETYAGLQKRAAE
jgi:rhodanese-related sulfurtransferase